MKPKILVFKAVWCGPCKMFAPVVDKAVTQLADKYTIEAIDIDDKPEVAQAFEIMSVPTIVHMEGDKIVKTRMGAFPTVDHLQKWIETA